jgi:hypothetical protein
LRFLGHLLLMIGVALCVGFGLSWYALSDGRVFGQLHIGPWTAWAEVGSPTPDPYTRAFVSRSGTLQLGSSEGIQFTAATDSDGRRLERSCRYRIDGSTPVASFWTLTPVDADGTIIARQGGPAAFNSTRLARNTDGSLELYVSRSISPRNWLEITGDGPFSLVLTLYDSGSFDGTGTADAELPAIIREGCP